MDPKLILFAVPAFALALLGELWLARRRGLRLYRAGDTVSNLATGIGAELLAPLFAPLTVGVYAGLEAAWRWRIRARGRRSPGSRSSSPSTFATTGSTPRRTGSTCEREPVRYGNRML